MFRPDPKPEPRVKKNPKPLQRKPIKKARKPTGETNLFQQLWEERRHQCQWCWVYLGDEFNHAFFDHVIEKSKAPKLRLEPANIRLLCLRCHHARHFGTKEQIQERIKLKI